MSQAQKILIENINALAELERVGWGYEPRSNYEVLLRCPMPEHADKNPSVSLNVKKNKWNCHVCPGQGDIVSLLAHILRVERQVVLADLVTRYDLKIVRTINPATIEKYHKQIWKAGPLLQELYERGVTDELIRKARLGYHDGRIMIPIYDKNCRVINVRKYLPGAPGSSKMRNITGYSGIVFYQVEQLKYESIWVCGGEIKALVAAPILNKHNIGALAVTGGEGSWSTSLTQSIQDKEIFICMDIDSKGLAAANRIASQIVLAAKKVHIIHLPLDIEKYPKGDINDWVAKENAVDNNFLEVMKVAKEFQFSITEDDKLLETVNTNLYQATASNNVGKIIQFDAIISAMDTTPFLIPKTISISCSRDQPNCTFCLISPMKVNPDTGNVVLSVKGTSRGILDMVNAPKKVQREATREALCIPVCKSVSFTIKDHHRVSDIRLSPQLDVTGDNSEYIIQPALLTTDQELELNSPYILTGRVYPHPKNQQAVLLLDQIEKSADSLASFVPSKTQLALLSIFKPDSWTPEAIKEKLDDIYSDFEANITRIYKRRELHLALDLVWHSCLYFEFDGRQQNGWVNLLVTGDSSQGKSEASIQLLNHYCLGIRHDCKNATVAGLLGGLEQLGARWFVSWGVIPLHDRQLVIMEEIKGAPIDVISRLTDMRSSGIAELTKIEKRKAHARTRLIMISNPRSSRPIDAYNFGIEAIKELIGNLEDIRRFDFAIILASKHIDAAEINFLSTQQIQINHKYTSDSCRQLILWTWTRHEDQIQFDNNAIQACLKYAISMCEKFTEAMPLVDRGTMRYKLARLSIALAARTFSTDKDLTILRVRKCHVDFIYQYLLERYTDPIFGYEDFSSAQTFMTKIIDTDVIRRQILSTRYPRDFVEHLLHSEDITMIDICDWCEMDRDNGQKLLSLLVRKHALYREKRWYTKSSEFIALLKEMKRRGIEETPLIEGDEF